jgi:HAD superfamily hydrolase (TIGR01484 family)
MKALDALDSRTLGQVEVLLTDIDDTLTTEGRLTAAAYGALERLQQAGVKVVPVTGRPAGWCDHIARMWPVDGIIGENGAFAFVYDRRQRKMRSIQAAELGDMQRNRARLSALGEEILAKVPGTALASDQPYRLADLAIDFCEDVPPLPREAVSRIVALFEAAGATAKVSSIHVNGWFGRYDKLSMARTVLAGEFGIALTPHCMRIAFSGDSPNDAPMFGAVALSIGVANIRDMLDQVAHKPAFVTRGRGGAGFVEIADRLIAARRAAVRSPA